MKLKRGLIILGLVLVVLGIAWLGIPVVQGSRLVNEAAKAILGSAPLGHLDDDALMNERTSRKASKFVSLKQACAAQHVPYPPQDLRIVVDKSDYTLYLYSGESTLLKSYPVSFGRDPVNDKVKEGDGRTPEGDFYICQKAENPAKRELGTRWMRLSYPNEEDAERGLRGGLIDERTAREIGRAIGEGETPPQRTPLGGGIGIHGGTKSYFGGLIRSWTAGCIALYDRDIEEFYDFVAVGAKVTVRK